MSNNGFREWWKTYPWPREHDYNEGAFYAIKAAYAAGKEAAEKDFIKQQEEITDMCIVSWVSTLGTLKEKVMRLIDCEVVIALDPAVSSDAQALVDKGFNAGLERAAEICKNVEIHKVIAHDRSNQPMADVMHKLVNYQIASIFAEAIREEIKKP